jgi:hypothetical protein
MFFDVQQGFRRCLLLVSLGKKKISDPPLPPNLSMFEIVMKILAQIFTVPNLFKNFIIFIFETGSCYVAHTVLKL